MYAVSRKTSLTTKWEIICKKHQEEKKVKNEPIFRHLRENTGKCTSPWGNIFARKVSLSQNTFPMQGTESYAVTTKKCIYIHRKCTSLLQLYSYYSCIKNILRKLLTVVYVKSGQHGLLFQDPSEPYSLSFGCCNKKVQSILHLQLSKSFFDSNCFPW